MLQSFFFWKYKFACFYRAYILSVHRSKNTGITTSINKSSAPLYHLTDRCHGKSAVCNVRELEISLLACELYLWRNVWKTFLLRVCKGLVLGLAPFRCFQPMWTHLHIFTLQSHAFCLTQRWIINKATLSGFQNLHVRCLSVQRICSFHVKAKPLFIFFFQSNQHLQRRWHKKKTADRHFRTTGLCTATVFEMKRLFYCIKWLKVPKQTYEA